MNILLISQGGCGTNWLKARYGAERMCAGLPDLNPHQRLAYVPKNTKVLYLQAHPLVQLCSFDRRGFFSNNQAVRNLGGNEIAFRNIQPEGTFQKYLNLGINCFLFADHRQAWQRYCIQNEVEIRFVSYESLADDVVLSSLDSWVGGVENDLPFSDRESVMPTDQGLLDKFFQIHAEDVRDYEFVYTTYAS